VKLHLAWFDFISVTLTALTVSFTCCVKEELGFIVVAAGSIIAKDIKLKSTEI